MCIELGNLLLLQFIGGKEWELGGKGECLGQTAFTTVVGACMYLLSPWLLTATGKQSSKDDVQRAKLDKVD